MEHHIPNSNDTTPQQQTTTPVPTTTITTTPAPIPTTTPSPRSTTQRPICDLTTSHPNHDQRLLAIAEAYETIIRLIGDDPTREAVIHTPIRAAKGIMEITSGYEGSIDSIINTAVFQSEYEQQLDYENANNDFVIVRDIEFNSLCEHHLLPFSGHVHIGYVPKDGKVLGLSKFCRVTDLYSKRLQIQEGLTRNISNGLYNSKLQPYGVIVAISAQHSCMSCRGVKKSGSSTITVAVSGKITPLQRQEFLLLTRGDNGR